MYYPDTLDCFEKTIFEKDRYEWTRRLIKKASKHIFVRDVYKIWYQKGINAKINSIPKLTDFLRKETGGYDKIIMVGSSAGGYAASLFGSLLKADIILNFNGQWEINSQLLEAHNTTLEKLQAVCGQYYDLVPILQHTSNIFYFVSERSNWDQAQCKHSTALRLNRIYFNTSHHGIPFPKCALENVMNMEKMSLIEISSRHYNPLIFSIKLAGLLPTLHDIYKIVTNKYF